MDSDFYKEFENTFRGSRSQIIKILSNYDGLIDYVLNIDNDPSLLDIGSGRGEWIQKCNARGFQSIGIELDSEMVKESKDFNLIIKEGDALSLLDEFSAESFSIVSAFHVIEHMEHEKIKEILVKAKRILKPDGLLLLETPSIDNLLVSTKSFHIDPTHITPIHPDLLAFMVKRAGFTQQKYYFINGGPLQYSDSDKLTKILNGVAQDLVLIATKSNLRNNSIFDDVNLIQRDMRLAQTTLEAAIDFDNLTMNRYAQYDEAIFTLRRRIIELERQILFLRRIYHTNFLIKFVKKIIKLKRKMWRLMVRSKKIYKSLYNFSINTELYIVTIKKLYKIQSIFFLLRYLEKKIDNFGYRICQYKLVRKSKKLKEDYDLVVNHERNLDSYFNTSEEAKKIFVDLNKDIKL
ncbi:class I SAM-dependent methyltransferase [Prochlorococcus marinus]|uniref:class I SAM-dependent methyltransferase n=1 Tax=Prochlorococcus marinus TaxID=1219 RepID=UPI0022B35022|nr:class I SAM-dependent methyltransferase [Prochlorococcus marinus]